MLSVQEAQARILSSFNPVGTQTMSLERAAGRVLAEDILADTDLPPFDNSGMDGFALRSADTSRASPSAPVTLNVIADIPAGDVSTVHLRASQAARIMTGAQIPPGADAVVMIEETDFHDRRPGSPAPEKVTLTQPVRAGSFIRRRGDDVRAGDRVLGSGTRLRAQEIGLLAMLGRAEVAVHRLPRLALLSSGDELLPVDAPLAPGKIRDANSFTLATLAEGSGADILRLGVAADNADDVRSRLDRAAAAQADVIVSSAGVSVGSLDYIKTVVEEQGELDFWQVNMRPGKPLAFGRYRGIPFFGLPGNPVSAFIGFEVFVRPALEKLSGMAARPHPRRTARLAEGVESDGRESYLRAVVSEEGGGPVVRLAGHQGSGNIFSLVRANALLIVPSGVKSLPAGLEVEIWPLD